MTNLKQSSQAASNEVEITLGLLNAVHENDTLTQRTVAQDLGIALGLANAYLKRCVKKGFVKVQQIPKNRYAYYLTPQGFAEKTRLTTEYLSISFNFFRSARTQCEGLLAQCEEKGWRKVLFVGGGDLCEIATLCAHEYEVELIGVLDSAVEGETYSGLLVLRDNSCLDRADAVIITDLQDPQAAHDAIKKILPLERILAPALLKIFRQPSSKRLI